MGWKEDGLLKAQTIAKERGGYLVSKEYVNNQAKLEWKCSNKEHPTFFIKYNKVSCNNQWCSNCKAKTDLQKKEITKKIKEEKLKQFELKIKKTKSLDERRDLIFKKLKEKVSAIGATVVSSEYKNQYQKLELSCNLNKEHPNWFISVIALKTHKGCPICYPLDYIGLKTNIDNRRKSSDLKKLVENIVKEKSGKIIEHLPRGDAIFSCLIDGHNLWKARVRDVVVGSWCRECANESYRLKNKQQIEALASAKGGTCLNPEEYTNNRKLLTWKCSDDEHPTWQANFHSIKNLNSWCPECANTFKSESRTRAMLELLLDVDLPKAYPNWLKNDLTGRGLELDGFNEKEAIAFEFQGLQHYVDSFGGGSINLANIQYRDALKKKLCDEKGVKLLVVDESHKTKKPLGLFREILKELDEKNLSYNKDIDEKKIEEIFYSY